MCWEQPEHSFLYLFFLRLILLPELAAIKLGGQIVVLFSFSLPISPMESSSSAPLCSAARPEGASEVLQDCQVAFISPCAITHSTSSVQSGDCFSAQALMPVVYKGLWVVALQNHLIDDAIWGERKPSGETAGQGEHLTTVVNMIPCSNGLPNMQLSLLGWTAYSTQQTEPCPQAGDLYCSRYFCLVLRPSFDGYL